MINSKNIAFNKKLMEKQYTKLCTKKGRKKSGFMRNFHHNGTVAHAKGTWSERLRERWGEVRLEGKKEGMNYSMLTHGGN